MEAEAINQIDAVTELLDDIVTGNIIKPIPKKFEPKLRFIIARKWNSWYPSYFDTKGGCYAFITRDTKEDPEKNSGVIVIDPGFNFSEILRTYNVEPHDLRTIIVSHYHPDHTMGLFGLLTLTNETKYPCSYYLNKTSFDTFKSFQGKHNKIIELTENQVAKIAQYELAPNRQKIESNIMEESIYLRTIKTFHAEIGGRHNTLGFIFHIINRYKMNENDYKRNNECDNVDKPEDRIENHHLDELCRYHEQELVILGDTDGNQKYLDSYLRQLKNARIVLLHLGSFSQKGYGQGNKHLYRNGMVDILNCINCVTAGKVKKEGKLVECINKEIIKYNSRSSKVRSGPKSKSCEFRSENYFEKLELVIISELGLEMASIPEMLTSFKNLKWFTKFYPLLLLMKAVDSKKPKSSCELFSTKTFRHIRELIEKDIKNIEPAENIDLYNTSIFLGLHCYMKTLICILRRKNIEAPKGEELKKYINDFLGNLLNIENRCNFESAQNFSDFKTKFSELLNVTIGQKPEIGTMQMDKEFIENFEKRFNRYFSRLVITCYTKKMDTGEYSRSHLLDDITELSEYLFESRRNLIKKGTSTKKYKELINSWKLNFADMAIIARSMNLINGDLFILLNQKSSEGLPAFNSLVWFIAFEIDKTVSNIKANIDQLEKFEGDERCKGLWDFLKIYNMNNKNIKYFVSDIGIEIDLSTVLQIRDSRAAEWIPLKNAKQIIVDDNYQIIRNE